MSGNQKPSSDHPPSEVIGSQTIERDGAKGMKSSKYPKVLVLIIALAMSAAACADSGGVSTTTESGGTSVVTTSTAPGVATNASVDDSAARPFEGTTVEIMGAFVEPATENFATSVAGFEEETGIDIVYNGSGDWVTLIGTRVEAGDPPDISFFPNPGGVADFARSGDLVPLPQSVRDVAEANYIDSWLDLGTVDGELYGLAYSSSVKSLVWYSPTAFAAAGYEAPATWDELLALSDQIVADGGVPWCIGFESGEASGWPGTDWIEDILLREQGPEYYDQWVANEVKFTDPGVVQAFETFGNIALNEAYVFGGRQGILTTPFGDAGLPMFAPEGPQCWLHHQASFYTAFLPEGTAVAPDGDTWVFPLPPINEEVGNPVMGGGDLAAAFNDKPEVMAVMEFLATPESGLGFAAAGGYVSPHKDFDLENYPDGIDRAVGEAMAGATVFRFDGSDTMPVPTALTFLGEMVNYVNGDDLAEVLARIDEVRAAEG